MGFLVRVLGNAVAIWLAVAIVPGIEARGIPTILGAGLVLGLVNAVVRPVLLVLTFPLSLVTLGLFVFVLNAFCLWLTAALVKGFAVRGFWAAASARSTRAARDLSRLDPAGAGGIPSSPGSPGC